MKDFHTEDEACELICPYSYSEPTEDMAGGFSKCCASECMAWRWSHASDAGNNPPTGFCGAFGLPRYA